MYTYAPSPIDMADPLGLSYIDHTSTNGGRGFDIYAICKDGGAVGYVGQTGDLTERTPQHIKSGRLLPNERLERVVNVPTYGDARGYEQALMEQHNTLNGVWGCPCSKTNVGNKKVGFDKNSASRIANHPARHQAFMNGYNAAKQWIADNPSLMNPCS